MTFPTSNTTGVGYEQAMLKIEPVWFGFEPTLFGYYSYKVQWIRQKKFSIKFWRHFLVWTPREQVRSRESWKSGPDDLVFHPEPSHTVWNVVLIVSRHYTEKMFRSNFNNISKLGHHRSRQSWKRGPDDSILHPRHTHTVWCAILIISRCYGWKCFCQVFTNFSGPHTTRAGPEKTKLKTGPNDLVLYHKHTYTIWGAVLILSRRYNFKLYQTNFDDFCKTEHHRIRPHIVSGVLIIYHCYDWKMFQSNFAYFFGPEHHRSR